MRVNMYPNPRFSPDGASTGAWHFDYANDMPGDGTLRPSNSQGYDELRIPELEPGVEYVFSVRSENRLGSGMLVIADKYSQRAVPDGSGLIVVRLTAPATGSQQENRVVFDAPECTRNPSWSSPRRMTRRSGGILASSPATRCHSADAAHRAGDAR